MSISLFANIYSVLILFFCFLLKFDIDLIACYNIFMNTKKPILLIDWMTTKQCGIGSQLTCDAQDAVYHSHDFYEIFYVLEGDITHIINKKEETLTMGDMLFISPKDFHGFIRKPNQLTSKHRDIVINKSQFRICCNLLGEKFMESVFIAPPTPCRAHLSTEQIRHFESRLNTINLLVSPSDSEKRNALVQITLSELFGVFFDEMFKKVRQYPQWLQSLLARFTMIDYMKEGLDKILEDTYLSRSHCCRVFKKMIGKTMEQYLCQNRLSVAANLLQFTDNKIIDICNNVGISSVAYFNKQFKIQFGYSPNQFRKIVRMKIDSGNK